jgi:hypothetical protein
MAKTTYDPEASAVANAAADAEAKRSGGYAARPASQQPLSLAQMIYGHLRINEPKPTVKGTK